MGVRWPPGSSGRQCRSLGVKPNSGTKFYGGEAQNFRYTESIFPLLRIWEIKIEYWMKQLVSNKVEVVDLIK